MSGEQGRAWEGGTDSCVLLCQRVADLFQPGTRVAQNKSARLGLRVGKGTTHTLPPCAGGKQVSCCSQRGSTGVRMGEVGQCATTVLIQPGTHLARALVS